MHKADFEDLLECTAPKCWSKYTRVVVNWRIFIYLMNYFSYDDVCDGDGASCDPWTVLKVSVDAHQNLLSHQGQLTRLVSVIPGNNVLQTLQFFLELLLREVGVEGVVVLVLIPLKQFVVMLALLLLLLLLLLLSRKLLQKALLHFHSP